MILGHIILHARRQKLRLIDLPWPEMLAHGQNQNQTRRQNASDYSDRLLAGKNLNRLLRLQRHVRQLSSPPSSPHCHQQPAGSATTVPACGSCFAGLAESFQDKAKSARAGLLRCLRRVERSARLELMEERVNAVRPQVPPSADLRPRTSLHRCPDRIPGGEETVDVRRAYAEFGGGAGNRRLMIADAAKVLLRHTGCVYAPRPGSIRVRTRREASPP